MEAIGWWIVVGPKQVRPTDEQDGQRVDVGGDGDPTQSPLGREIGGDHLRRLSQERDAGWSGQAEPLEQRRPAADEGDDPPDSRIERGGQGRDEVVLDASAPSRGPKLDRLSVQPLEVTEHESGQEGVEVPEMSVEDAFGDASLGGNRSARHRFWRIAEEHALGRVEQLLADLGDRYS